jgi:Lrp/AsnC family leucine-responsive transcriptional regulator
MTNDIELDLTDYTLLGKLNRNGRASWAELAAEAGLTPPAAAQRVRRLVDRGVIRQFAASIAAPALGVVTAFVEVIFPDAEGHDEFRVAVQRLTAVQECYRVAGRAQYLLKIRARSPEELDQILTGVLPKAARGGTLQVAMVLSTIKESPVFPLPKPASPNP